MNTKNDAIHVREKGERLTEHFSWLDDAFEARKDVPHGRVAGIANFLRDIQRIEVGTKSRLVAGSGSQTLHAQIMKGDAEVSPLDGLVILAGIRDKNAESQIKNRNIPSSESSN